MTPCTSDTAQTGEIIHMSKVTKNFTREELMCKCGCDTLVIDLEAVGKLQSMRDQIGPIIITSAYRCKDHPIEAKKKNPGIHNTGGAFDIACSDSVSRINIIKSAVDQGVQGLGLHGEFIHVDFRDSTGVAWFY